MHVNVMRVRHLHIFMHTLVTRLTTQLNEHIGQSDLCTFTCTHQVNLNVHSDVCMQVCSKSDTWLPAHFMHTSVTGLTTQLHEHIRQSDQ